MFPQRCLTPNPTKQRWTLHKQKAQVRRSTVTPTKRRRGSWRNKAATWANYMMSQLQRSPGSRTSSHTVWLAAWSPPTPQLLVYAASCSGSCTMLRPDASQNKRGRNAESDARLNSCVAPRNELGWLMSFTRNMLSFTIILLSSRAQCILVSFVRPNRVGSSLDHLIHFHSQPAPQNHRKKRWRLKQRCVC